jgi:(p)ppGpp synthase/HD superfamily hydrolase
LKRLEAERAAVTGRQWLLDAGHGQGIEPDESEQRARRYAAAKGGTVEEVYRRVCLGDEDIGDVLGTPEWRGRRLSGGGLLRWWTGRMDTRRRVRRYDFEDPHIRFCPTCAPVEGDEIEGTPEQGRLLVHRIGCEAAPEGSNVPLTWEKGGKRDLRDPGPVELEVSLEDGPGALYTVLAPFKSLGVDIRNLKLPHRRPTLSIQFEPGSDRTLNRLMRALRKLGFVDQIRVFRAVI